MRVSLTDAATGETADAESGEVLIDPSATPIPATILISSIAATPAPTADGVQFANLEAVVVGRQAIDAAITIP